MSWWKKIFSVISLVFAGYEVGKTIEESDTKEIVKALRENHLNESVTENIEKPDFFEISLVILIIVILVIWVIKNISKKIKKRISRAVAHEQNHV